MANLWTLHVIRNRPNHPGGEHTYTLTIGPTHGPGGAMPQASPQSRDHLARVLEQIGMDQFTVAMFLKNVDAKGSDSLQGIELSGSHLRTLGFAA